MKEMSPTSSQETGREKRRKLLGTLGSWAGQGEQKRSPGAIGEWCRCWKTPNSSEVGFGDRVSAEPRGGQGVLGGSSAAAAVCCSARVGAAALKLWKVRGEEMSPKHDSSRKRDGCGFLFCFVSLFLLKGRELLMKGIFLLWC